jgi:hypothetical protein
MPNPLRWLGSIALLQVAGLCLLAVPGAMPWAVTSLIVALMMTLFIFYFGEAV